MNTAPKTKFSIKDFFSKCVHTADLVTFTEEILNGKLHFLYSESKSKLTLYQYPVQVLCLVSVDSFQVY